ncbi:hypothetical protein [Dysgonomonas mossii]|uniref:hypothetical protein n=1 Tax=Dysgonomonas mossii TaxID=163665 RepID=UPI003995B1E3
MFDGIRLRKELRNKAPNLDSLDIKATYYKSGWEYYIIHGCYSFNMELRWNPTYRVIEIWGNPLYFQQGHNFTADMKTFQEAIKSIERIIEVDLQEATVTQIEYGKTFEVALKPPFYIGGHFGNDSLSMWEKDCDRGAIRYFDDSREKVYLKLYDVGKNIKDKHKQSTRHLVKEAGWKENHNYIRFEVVYKSPELLNNKRPLLYKDLFSNRMLDVFNEDLYCQYSRITKKQSLDIPKTKKELGTGSIILRVLAESLLGQGGNLEKTLFTKINSFPDTLLSPVDKSARKRAIKALLKGLKTSIISTFDLSSKLERSLLLNTSL